MLAVSSAHPVTSRLVSRGHRDSKPACGTRTGGQGGSVGSHQSKTRAGLAQHRTCQLGCTARLAKSKRVAPLGLPSGIILPGGFAPTPHLRGTVVT